MIFRFKNIKQYYKDRLRLKKSFFKIFHLSEKDSYLDFELNLSFDKENAKNYRYSKLYYCTSWEESFDESRVICFHPRYINSFEKIRIAIPKIAQEKGVFSIRLDALPYCDGTYEVKDMTLNSGKHDLKSSHFSDLVEHRQWVREQVLESEMTQRAIVPHCPESISVELTARCNLKCPHCSSHGTAYLHEHHNQKNDISLDLLKRLGHELFPHITALSLVGRGEPTMATDETWGVCMDLVKQYNVKISCVTNGHFIRKRFTPELVPYIDELCISIDGNTDETHYINRGGSSLKVVLDNIEYFHMTRESLNLALRPKMSIYWTLMTNNINELPDFIRRIAPLEPDYFAIRHLVVFHEKDTNLSLIGKPELTNKYLKEAYAELKRFNIEYEAPPLMDEEDKGNIINEVQSEVKKNLVFTQEEPTCPMVNKFEEIEPCTWMHRTGIIMSDGEVTTCGKHYGQQVGMMDKDTSFMDIWNGPAMISLRSTFGTESMWQQCKDCWLRELKWHSQRRARDEKEEFTDDGAMSFTREAWDYREYSSL